MYELFDLNEAILFGESGRLLYVSLFKFERDWNGMRHSHDFTELFFCVGGKGSFSVRDQSISVEAGDFMIVNPTREHGESSTASAPLEYVVLGFSHINVLFHDAASGYYKGSFRSQSSLIRPLLTALIQEVSGKPDSYQAASNSILTLLFILLIRQSHFQLEPSAPALQPDQPSDHKISWIRQYIDDNFTKTVNLDLLASKIGLTKYSIIRSFNRAYGISPINYLLERRFAEARFLLRTTDNTVRQIAESLGFGSANYFSQCFQKKEGITPTQYREQARRHPSDSV